MFGLFDSKEKVKRDLIDRGIEPEVLLVRNKNLFVAFDTKNMYFPRAKTKEIFLRVKRAQNARFCFLCAALNETGRAHTPAFPPWNRCCAYAR